MIKAKKSLGQHWLRSQSALKTIIEAARLSASDIVLEIGPGTGALTEALLETKTPVIVIERDRELIPVLTEKFSEALALGQLKIITGDIIGFAPENVGLKNQEYKLVANIPYYLTGEIIRQFLSGQNQPKSLVLLIQREVAKRIVANNHKESLLSISVKVYGEPKYIKTVKREAFSPKPKVDSAILAINNVNKNFFDRFGVSEVDFFQVVRAGFAHKRKKLLRNLETIADLNKVSAIFKTMGLPENSRAEDLTLEQWGKLTFGITAPSD